MEKMNFDKLPRNCNFLQSPVMTVKRRYFVICSDSDKEPEGLTKDCQIVDEISEKDYNRLVSWKRLSELEEKRRQWRKEHGIPEPKPNYDDFGTPACTEDGEYMLSR